MSKTLAAALVLLAYGLSTAEASKHSRASGDDGAHWIGPAQGRARLIVGRIAMPAGATRTLAGIHIALAPGWKTYWRIPGDSGMPPAFDWSRSSNLARAEILYPAPARLPEGGMESIGYSSDVVFPLEISAENPDQPMRLVIDVEFGVCKDICMPVSGTLSVTLPGANEEHGPLIAAHLARVPLAAKPGDAAIKDVRVVRKKDRRMLVIAASFPTVDGSGDLFLDDPEGGPAPLTRRLDQTGGRFEADLGPPGDWARLNGKKLRATLVSSQGQCWTLITLPAQ